MVMYDKDKLNFYSEVIDATFGRINDFGGRIDLMAAEAAIKSIRVYKVLIQLLYQIIINIIRSKNN